MFTLTAFVSGLLFGIGLIVSNMANPAKVLGFLDIGGRWDPSLALVMAGAIGVGLIAFFVAQRRTQSYLGAAMQIPTARKIDRRCFLGSLTFGIGWGVAGFCPGPALVSLGSGQIKAVVFVAAMLAGMLLFDWIERLRADSSPDLTEPSNAQSDQDPSGEPTSRS